MTFQERCKNSQGEVRTSPHLPSKSGLVMQIICIVWPVAVASPLVQHRKFKKRFSGIFQLLEEVCLKNNWGSPVYTLHSTQAPNAEMQLFLYKVNIPALPTLYQPQKLCRSVEEAKAYAAEYVLTQLGIPFEGKFIKLDHSKVWFTINVSVITVGPTINECYGFRSRITSIHCCHHCLTLRHKSRWTR